MAIQWSSWSGGSGAGGFRAGIETTVYGSTTSVAYYVETGSNNVDDNQTLVRTGAITGNIDYLFDQSGTPPLRRYIGTWNHVGTPGSTYFFGAQITGVYSGASPSLQVAVTLPVAAPSATSTPSVTRVSDTSHTLSWSLNSSSSAPYSWVQVQRRESVGTDPGLGQWVAVVTLAATATTFTDTSTVANHAYQWRIGVGNASGTATSPPSVIMFTTPASPVGASVAAPSGIDHVISWTRGTLSIETTDRIEVSTDGGATWTQLASVPGSGVAACSWTNPSPTQGPVYKYRVRTVTASNGLASGYATTGAVATLAPPNPPTVTLPVGPVDRASAVTASWVHNPVDTTSQTAYELRYRVNGGAWVTLAGTTAKSRAIPAPGVSGTLEVQARTRGMHATFSEWSASVTVTLAARPTALINSPSGSWSSATVTVTWGFNAADGGTQVAVEVELLDAAGTRMGATWVGTTEWTAVLSGADQRVAHGVAYSVRARVRSSTGVWSLWDVSAFTVAYTPPLTPLLAVAWNRATGSTVLSVDNPAISDGEVATVRNDIERRAGTGAWEKIFAGVPVGATVVDPIPLLGLNVYRVIAYSVDGATALSADTEVAWTHDRCPVFVNTGDRWSTVVKAYGNAVESTPGQESDLYEWSDVPWPDAIYGPHRSLTLAFQGSLRDQDRASTPAEWREVLWARQDVCYRDCGEVHATEPRKIFGRLAINAQTQQGLHVNRIGFTINQTGTTEVERRGN